MKTRNLTTKHAFKNELKQLRVSKTASVIRCDNVIRSVDIEGGIGQEQGYQCVFYTKEQEFVNPGHLTDGHKVYAGPMVAGTQKTRFCYTNNRTDHKHQLYPPLLLNEM